MTKANILKLLEEKRDAENPFSIDPEIAQAAVDKATKLIRPGGAEQIVRKQEEVARLRDNTATGIRDYKKPKVEAHIEGHSVSTR